LILAGFLFAVTLAGAVAAEPVRPATALSPAAEVIVPEHFNRSLLVGEISRETNLARKEHGLRPLVLMIELEEAADKQAVMMAATLHATHDNPYRGERTVLDRVKKSGLRPFFTAENVAMLPVELVPPGESRFHTYASLAAALVQGWMNSPVHRANILNTTVTALGCSVRLARRDYQAPYAFAAQVFCLPSEGDGFHQKNAPPS
jgi:uncharacterized protein YkwD